MRLKQIKLAGFKSFVDVTKIPFQQQMTAIVGPNGCGKSNVIDAVRWVLGESSAKNLRGDAMTDVIFNGAASRKPVGQASVELVFENTQGRLQGSMADRSEVAIRRVVTREGISSYFLNGSKCRRRDITDIFLGTGLGPRSYAIIEQGTISRLIESKPQELRVFIEEAAGISKYKEKRRDTEIRIRHTRENLERLTDVIAELTAQIDKLHQQAEAAKRFKTLKSNERKYRAELAAMRWQQFDQQSSLAQEKRQAQQLNIEAMKVEQNKFEVNKLDAKQALASANEKISQYQQQKLQLSNDITRTEQNIKYRKQQQLSDNEQRQQLQKSFENNVSFQKHQQTELTTVNQSLAQYLPQLAQLELQLEQNQAELIAQQAKLQQCFEQWDKRNQLENSQQRQTSEITAKITAQETLIAQTKQQLLQLNNIEKNLKCRQPSSKTVNTENELQQALETTEQLKQRLDENKSQSNEAQQKVNEQQQNLLINQTKYQSAEKSLTQLQQSTTNPDWLVSQNTYLERQKINEIGQLFQQLNVTPKWQQHVELILSQWLSASVIEQFPLDLMVKNNLPDTLLLINNNGLQNLPKQPVINNKPGTISEQVNWVDAINGNIPPFLIAYLNTIYLADDIAQAQQLLPNLKAYESIICLDGTWLSAHFLRKGSIDNSEQLLVKQTQLIELKKEAAQLKQLEAENVIALSEYKSTLEKLKNEQQLLEQQFKKSTLELQALTQKEALAQQLAEHQHQQLVQNNKNIAQIQTLLEEQSQQLALLKKQQQEQVSEQASNNLESLVELSQKRETLQTALIDLQAINQQLVQKRHHLSLSVEKVKSKKGAIEQQIQSALDKQQQLSESLQKLNNTDLQQKSPLIEDEQQLQLWLKQMSDLELHLLEQNKISIALQHSIEELTKQNAIQQNKVEQLKESVNKHYLHGENANLRAQTQLDLLNDMGQNLSSVIANMPNNAKETQWQAQIIRLAKDISQLGPINLAAIDEYTRELTRKNFLDEQYQDLTIAINTLESAIAKIDKQSRQKFKMTFDQINKDLKTLFPQVFGGGNAYLALTGDDLLETGVTIMARPPGKKNSTIHLLSGGEKALTALSLVFAIFRLNPAPFCMLDEVDAPLDDANVIRFCNLVKEMSQTVQFIFISHNKIAMEMAAHLTGVTMFEAGVSRMVAVDIDEAVAMAETN